MSTNGILLETGSLDYLLDEANDPILLEELDTLSGSLISTLSSTTLESANYGNTGYVNQYFTIPSINLEDDTGILLEDTDNVSFLFLEHEYVDYVGSFYGVYIIDSYGSQNQYWGSGVTQLSNLTCSGLGQGSSTFGYLNPELAIGLNNLTVEANLTNIGTYGKTFSNLRGLSIIGRLNQNFGFLNSNQYDFLTLNNMSAQSSGVIVTPNYGYFVNYIY